MEVNSIHIDYSSHLQDPARAPALLLFARTKEVQKLPDDELPPTLRQHTATYPSIKHCASPTAHADMPPDPQLQG